LRYRQLFASSLARGFVVGGDVISDGSMATGTVERIEGAEGSPVADVYIRHGDGRMTRLVAAIGWAEVMKE